MLDSVLQFGASPFMRGFADLILTQANRSEVPIPGWAVVVAEEREAKALATTGGCFEVAVSGMFGGRVVDEVERVDAVSRVLRADLEWTSVREFAQRPELRWILWDETTARHDLNECDQVRPRDGWVPRGDLARLLDVLLARQGNRALDVAILPCGSEEGNGERLRDAVLALARRWRVAPEVALWLRHGVAWLNTLADRVVVESRWDAPHPDAARTRIITEPYAFWGIEVVGSQPFWTHPAVVLTEDLRPYRLRSGRVLKAARTAMEMRAKRLGVKTPARALDHPDLWGWLESVLREEIVPVLAGRVPEADAFASRTLERLRNPLAHLSAWSADLERESAIHLRPTLSEYFFFHGRRAPLLSAALDG
jgi:tagaturonate reductase